MFYRRAEYKGRCQLRVDLLAPTPVDVPDTSTRGVLVPSTHLFSEPLTSIRAEICVEESLNVHPLADDTIKKVLARVMLAIARRCERTLSGTFDRDVQPIVNEALKRITLQQV